ncbi:hypothetical protein [Shimia sp.]|uniref:hypothetical protein n=1 Tax=Shimia sp. TaxID=1954381 RepID=UPI003B8DB8E1
MPTVLPPSIDLQDGENALHLWRPVFRLFLTKLVFVSFVTALFLGASLDQAFDGHPALTWIGSMLVSMAFYAFVFDDVFEWRQRRGDLWVLTDRRLIFFNPAEEGSPSSIDLEKIRSVKPWMFWGILVRLRPIDSVTMLFVPNRKTVRHEITTIVSRKPQNDQSGAVAI